MVESRCLHGLCFLCGDLSGQLHYGLSSKIRISYGRERSETDERQRGDRPCGDSLRLRRIFRIPHHSAVGGDGDPDGTQTVGDHGHGRFAGRVGDLFDQHGLRRRIDRKAGDDLVVEPRHQPDVRGAELPGGRRTALPDRQLPARRPGSGYDPAFAGRLFPGLQGRRPRRFPPDRAGSRTRCRRCTTTWPRLSTWRSNTAIRR